MEVLQFIETEQDNNCTYLLYEPAAREVAVVDPCADNIAPLTEELIRIGEVTARWILLTHAHEDHISGLAALREFFPAPVCAGPGEFAVDQVLADRDRLQFGLGAIECFFTPGHSPDGFCFFMSGASPVLFSGDTLFIGDVGYGDPSLLFDSLHRQISPLPGNTEVYPGHHYWEEPHASLDSIKACNPFLAAKDYTQFLEAVRNRQ